MKKVIIFSILAMLLSGFFIYKRIIQHNIRPNIVKNRNFGILFYVYKGKEKKKISFISVVTIQLRSKKFGVMSVYPKVIAIPKGNQKESKDISFEEMMLKKGVSYTRNYLQDLLSMYIPHYIGIDVNTLKKLLDILGGIKYFLWNYDLLQDEDFPTGEFLLESSLIEEFLYPQVQLEITPAITIFRNYSFFLKLFMDRKENWNILSNKRISHLLFSKVKSSLSIQDLYYLTHFFHANSNWTPSFFEIPVKKKGTIFTVDSETLEIYINNLLQKLSQKQIQVKYDNINLIIRNGTHVPNLARRFRVNLHRKGITVLEFSNADHKNYKKSILLDINGNYIHTNMIAKILGIKKVYPAINKIFFTDMVLILGKDYVDLENNLAYSRIK